MPPLRFQYSPILSPNPPYCLPFTEENVCVIPKTNCDDAFRMARNETLPAEVAAIILPSVVDNKMMHSGYQPIGQENKSVSIAAVCGFAAAVALAGFASYEFGFQSQAPTQMYATTAVRPATRVAPAAAPLSAMTRGAQTFAEGMSSCSPARASCCSFTSFVFGSIVRPKQGWTVEHEMQWNVTCRLLSYLVISSIRSSSVAQAAAQESESVQFGGEQVIAAPATNRVAQLLAMMGVASIVAGAVILFREVFQSKQSIAMAAQISMFVLQPLDLSPAVMFMSASVCIVPDTVHDTVLRQEGCASGSGGGRSAHEHLQPQEAFQG